jgi:hypothetical protein
MARIDLHPQPPLGDKCILVIWTPMPIFVEDGWPPHIVLHMRDMTRTSATAGAAISQRFIYSIHAKTCSFPC